MPETNWWNARDNEGFIFALSPAPATPEVPKPTASQINSTCRQLDAISRTLRVHSSKCIAADGKWVAELQDRLDEILNDLVDPWFSPLWKDTD